MSAMQTDAAAQYLGISPAWLKKLRLKAPDDPGVKGPRYIKIGKNTVLYRTEDLDAWLEAHAHAQISA